MPKTTNIVIAGVGGQGVLTASDILSVAAFNAGFDTKKSEIHGMSQRGGSVTSDVRFGSDIASPMVPDGEADFVVVISPDQEENVRYRLRQGGKVLSASEIDVSKLANPRCVNVALLGRLSQELDIQKDAWNQALKECLPEKILEINQQAFEINC
jgi:indolepyruvate ferredoxin oxidoreductase beta subunit